MVVSRNASARIVGNQLIGNAWSGVSVVRLSQADVAGNVIEGNLGHGIEVSQGSAVNLGNDSGAGIADLANTTGVANPNHGFGIACGIGGYANGRSGSLTGLAGPASFSGGCINSLLP